MDAWSKYSGPHLKQHTELVWRRWREGEREREQERERELLEIGNFKLLVSTRRKPSGPWLNGNPLKISTWSSVSLWAICCLCALSIPWLKVLPKERAARRSSVWVPKSKQLGRTTKPWQALVPFCSSAMLAKILPAHDLASFVHVHDQFGEAHYQNQSHSMERSWFKRLQETMAHIPVAISTLELVNLCIV